MRKNSKTLYNQTTLNAMLVSNEHALVLHCLDKELFNDLGVVTGRKDQYIYNSRPIIVLSNLYNFTYIEFHLPVFWTVDDDGNVVVNSTGAVSTNALLNCYIQSRGHQTPCTNSMILKGGDDAAALIKCMQHLIKWTNDCDTVYRAFQLLTPAALVDVVKQVDDFADDCLSGEGGTVDDVSDEDGVPLQ